MSSAWWRTNCAPGRRSGSGATSSASARRTAPTAVCCSSASSPTPNVPVTWRSAGRCRRNVLDLSPVFRNLTNGRLTPEGKGLLGALRYFGFEQYRPETEGRDARAHHARLAVHAGRARKILNYCAGDVDALTRLLARMLPSRFDLGIALLPRRIRRRLGADGAPRRADRHGDVLRNSPTRHWRAVRDAMVPAIDAQYGVYVRNAAGDWSFNMERFAAYLAREGILGAGRGLRQRQARHATQDVREHVEGLAAARRPAPAAPHARQDAQDQAGGRRRRPQSHGAVAVQGQDLAHATEGRAVDLLAGGVAALADQARTGDGGRLHRLFQSWSF